MQEIKQVSETWCLSILQFSLNAHMHMYFLAFSFLGLLPLVLLLPIWFKDSSDVIFNIFKFIVWYFFPLSILPQYPAPSSSIPLVPLLLLEAGKVSACSCIIWSPAESSSTKLPGYFLIFFSYIYVYISPLPRPPHFPPYYYYCFPAKFRPCWSIHLTCLSSILVHRVSMGFF